jgi:hypothetical protein
MSEKAQSGEVEKFAIDLARELSRRCPADKVRSGGQSTGTLARAIDEVCNRAADFQRRKRLGVYGKAKLGTEFKLEVKELGYAAEFADELTSKLLISMSGK